MTDYDSNGAAANARAQVEFSATSELTPEQLAELAKSVELSESDLVAPPRKDFIHEKGYHLRVKSATFKKSQQGQEQAELKVVALDHEGTEVKRATGMIFLSFPWETKGFKFRDIDARARAMQDFKTLLTIAKPELRLVKTVQAGDLKTYFDAKSGLKLEGTAVAGGFKNEQIQVSIVGRQMQQGKDVSVFVGATFYAQYNVWHGTGELAGKSKRQFQGFSSSQKPHVQYVLDPAKMLAYPAGQEPEGAEAAADSELVF